MTKARATSGALLKPFTLLWRALTNISKLDRRQVRSLVTVGFLCGMVSLSAESWGLTFYFSNVLESEVIAPDKKIVFVDFLADRMRNISALQGLITLVLGAVILNADRISAKGPGGTEITVGGSGTDGRGISEPV